MNILIIKMWAIGDILMATPMLNAIRAGCAGARISWLVDSQHADILAGHPQIDELIVIDTGAWRRLRRQGKLAAWVRRTRQLNAQIKERAFDAVINGQAADWWSFFLCAAPKRIGLFSWPHKALLRRLYAPAIARPRLSGLHNTEHFLQATSALGFPSASKKMSIGEPPEEEALAEAFWSAKKLGKEKLTVALAPISTSPNRSIAPAQAARIAGWLCRELGAQVIVTCGPRDGQKARQIVEEADVDGVVLAEDTSLCQYMGILRRVDLVVTCDSSPMHLAAAMGTPYVALFGPTPAQERAPLMGEGQILEGRAPCAPCDLPTCANKVFQECMQSIADADVERAIGEVLGAKTAGGARRK